VAYLKAEIVMFLGVYFHSRLFIDCNLLQMGLFIVARFLLTSMSHGPSAIAELLVVFVWICCQVNAVLKCTICTVKPKLVSY